MLGNVRSRKAYQLQSHNLRNYDYHLWIMTDFLCLLAVRRLKDEESPIITMVALKISLQLISVTEVAESIWNTPANMYPIIVEIISVLASLMFILRQMIQRESCIGNQWGDT